MLVGGRGKGEEGSLGGSLMMVCGGGCRAQEPQSLGLSPLHNVFAKDFQGVDWGQDRFICMKPQRQFPQHCTEPVMMAHAYNPSLWELEAGESEVSLGPAWTTRQGHVSKKPKRSRGWGGVGWE